MDLSNNLPGGWGCSLNLQLFPIPKSYLLLISFRCCHGGRTHSGVGGRGGGRVKQIGYGLSHLLANTHSADVKLVEGDQASAAGCP